MTKRTRQRGGNSAWQYMNDTVGALPTQLTNALSASNPNGNEIVALRGAGHQPFLNANLNSILKGGRRKTKKGGMWGAISQAIAPITLFGLQQSVRFKPKRTNKYRNRNKTYRRH